MNSKRQVYCKGETWSRGTNLHLTLDVTWCLTSLIDLFSLYVLFSQYRSCEYSRELFLSNFVLSTCICTREMTKCQVPLGPLLGKQNIQAKEVCTSQSSATSKPGGEGGYSTNVYSRRLRPEVQPLTLNIAFFTKKVPLPFNRCKCTVFYIGINHKIERFPTFSSHKIVLLALLGPFTDPNDRFTYSSIYFN